MASTPRMLLLLRHAEAATFEPGHGDIDRPLNDEGREQARQVGAWLAEAGTPIDQVLCSAAARTRQTVELLDLSAPVEYTEDLYNAGSDAIREVLATVDDTANTVLVVGHAPGVPTLVHDLADQEATEPEMLHKLSHGFATATLVGIAIEGTWAHPLPGQVTFVVAG